MMSTSGGNETCVNCGRTIGRLEVLQFFQNHKVCAECFGKLEGTVKPSKTKVTAASEGALPNPLHVGAALVVADKLAIGLAKLEAAGESLLTLVPAARQKQLPVVYRGTLAVAVVACFLPWLKASASSSFLGKVESASITVSGLDATWGSFALIFSLVGIGLSFVGPAGILGTKARATMSAIGLLVALCALMVFFRASSYLPVGVGYNDNHGNSVHVGLTGGIGLYLALLCGMLVIAVGLAIRWSVEPSQPVFTPSVS